MPADENVKCPICLKPPQQEIDPFCSVECLHANPATGKDPDLQRRISTYVERSTGAGGPGGMTSGNDRDLQLYLAGAQDEAAHKKGRP